ncbi:MAG TPA: thaumatin family protein [Ktedonobacteraceae bacterium]|nr:thaumatin family protein [Ktedonobacteraceae bacterium]
MKQRLGLFITQSRVLLALTIAFAGLVFGGISVSHELTTHASPQVNTVQINAGGGGDAPFAADEDFSGGRASKTKAAINVSGVSNPAPQGVYQTYRYGDFTYSIPNLVPNASYTVSLDFAETYWTKVGQRIFDVKLNGQQVLSNFDILAASGGANKAVVKQFSATADATGKLTIQFIRIKDNALVNGIGVFAGSMLISPPTPTPSPTPLATQAIPTQVVPPPAPAGQHTFSFRNTMSQTVWVGMSSSKYIPLNGGWALAPNASMSVTLPYKWGGRIWGRTGCTFNSAGMGSCETGDCNGRLQCAGADGQLPRSLGEFNLNSWHGMDFYDISLVDGYNVPMFINTFGGNKPDAITSTGCISRPASDGPSGCIHDVNATCPAVLQKKDASGKVISCQVACNVFHTDQYCCRGPYMPRAMCNPASWPVNYAKVFKDAVPFAYSYPDDDATSTFTCAPDCNYWVTFGLTG